MLDQTQVKTKKLYISCLLSLIMISLFANDGAYYASGNHLIPITDADIAVTKEILTVSRYKEAYLRVNVYYEFYNHGAPKAVLVGFEAPSPSGDVDGYPVNGRHPYISKFSVVMNDESLSHQTAIVTDSIYYKNKKILTKTENEVIGKDFNTNEPEFYYVYHFNAKFKKGLNIIKHQYMFKLSGSIMDRYSFDYILTAANRWSNKQIDDFTLIINMGDEENFSVRKSFYDQDINWTINGNGLINGGKENSSTEFYIDEGKLTFHQKDFTPIGELYLAASRNYQYCSDQQGEFDIETCTKIPFDISYQKNLQQTANQNSYKVLRNLPFARRGYIFKTTLIQRYYEQQSWYIPNPEYSARLDNLFDIEKDWLQTLKDNNPF